MKRPLRGLAGLLGAGALFVGSTLGVLAGHESNNRFDLAPVGLAPTGADGSGVSNYVKGRSSDAAEVWNSHVKVSDLAPATRYSFWAENANDALDAQDTLICAFTTDAGGDGGCSRTFHPEPAFARARIRVGDGFGPIVLEASGSTDPDNRVDEGEIERRGDCRSPDQVGGSCDAPGRN